jgi:hypothetical protein
VSKIDVREQHAQSIVAACCKRKLYELQRNRSNPSTKKLIERQKMNTTVSMMLIFAAQWNQPDSAENVGMALYLTDCCFNKISARLIT